MLAISENPRCHKGDLPMSAYCICRGCISENKKAPRKSGDFARRFQDRVDWAGDLILHIDCAILVP